VRDLKEEVARVQLEARKRFLPPDCYFKAQGTDEACPEADIAEIDDKQVGNNEDATRCLLIRKQPVPKTTMEAIRMHLYSSLPIHCRKTLSQYYYHLRLQKPKQVVTCHFEDHWPHEDPLTLMVDQLWMFVLVDGTPSDDTIHRFRSKSQLTFQVLS
jgi:hypothetical protein